MVTDALPGHDTWITLGAALLMGLLVGVARVLRERGEQSLAGTPLTPVWAVFGDVIYSALGGMAAVLLMGTLFHLAFKAQLAVAMVGASLGPNSFDLAASVLSGGWKISLRKKDEGKNGGET